MPGHSGSTAQPSENGQRAKRGPGPLSKSTSRSINFQERAQRVVDLRRAGVSWDNIAKQLGYAGPTAAYQAFQSYMINYPKESVDQAREVEANRLDQLQQAIWQQCLQEGKNQHWAIDRMVKIMELRTKLLGLNAPVRQEVTVLTESTVDKAIRELQEQLGATAAAHGVEMPAEMAELAAIPTDTQ